MSETLDQDAVNRLTGEITRILRAHYERRPTSRASAQEVLNALAINVAIIFQAAREAGDEIGARDFFALALEGQRAAIATVAAARPPRARPPAFTKTQNVHASDSPTRGAPHTIAIAIETFTSETDDNNGG